MAKSTNSPKTPQDSGRSRPSALARLAICCVLAVLVLAVYWQVHGFEFLHIDDTTYILENPHVLAGLSIHKAGWAFTTFRASNWHPLTWLSLMFDASIAGRNAGFYHVHNLVLHIASTLLLFGLLTRVTGAVWRSAFVAALFGLHPLHVESVAWITERKDVLSTVFWLLTTWLYMRYTERPRIGRYLAMLAAYALGLMAKPMLVALPITLLLLDYWPLGRLRSAESARSTPNTRPLSSLMVEKLALFALAAASCVVTFVAQRAGGAVTGLEIQPLGARAANAVVSYVAYILKMLWPANLAVFYPMPHEGHPALYVTSAAMVLIAISAAVVLLRRRARFLLVGWLWYVITLVPVIGLVQVGSQAMADRYTYVPLIGLFIAIAWGVPELLPKARTRWLAIPAGAVILALAICARTQVGHWRDSKSLAEHAISSVPDNYKAQFDLGLALAEEGKLDEAIEQYNLALSAYPNNDSVHGALSVALLDRGDIAGAMEHARRAVEINPRLAGHHANLGMVLMDAGDLEQAAAACSEALRMDPDLRVARNTLAYALIQLDRTDEAQVEASRALENDPRDPDALNNQGMIDLDQGQLGAAEEHFRAAIRFDAKLAEAYNNLGVSLVRQNRIEEAIVEFRRAIELDPKTDYFRRNLEKTRALAETSGRHQGKKR